jgi:hypothetical protein
MDDSWLMRIERGLSAHFKQGDGTSRPGVEWSVGLKRGNELHSVTVKALLADDASAATRANSEYQARTAMQYLNDQLSAGWNPAQEREHVIYITNPTSTNPRGPHEMHAAQRKPWWKLW